MDSGLSTAALGMLAEFNGEENISNNLANLQTPGYKERSAVQQDFTQVLVNTQQGAEVDLAMDGFPTPGTLTQDAVGRLGSAPQIKDYGLNLAQGNARYTGSPNDLMIVGNGFFTVRAGNQTLLTRNGSFHRSAQGALLTAEGYPVLDQGGHPIKVPNGALEVGQDGTLTVNGVRHGRIGLATVPQGQPLTENGNGYYTGPGRAVTGRGNSVGILQGYLESSNVDLATQMSAMLSAQRSYQADSQMLQAADSTMGLAVNDLGKVNG